MANKRWERAKTANPAAIYNEKRRIIFSHLAKDPSEAKVWLDGYRGVLGAAGHAGLKAEVEFYERYRKDLRLVLAADVGDATDFSGFVDGAPHRIDVTTNLNFKDLKAYEPLQLEGDLYKIAVFDGSEFELIDINYPFCPHCETGRVLPTAMLLGENRDKEGASLWSNDQLLVKICSGCEEVEVADRITTPFLHDFGAWYDVLNEADQEAAETGDERIDVDSDVARYAQRASRYLSNAFGTRLVGVGSQDYEITDPRNADGYWAYKFVDRLPLVNDHLKEIYPWDISQN